MRVFAIIIMALLAANGIAAGPAAAQIPQKQIKIFNNTNTVLYPIIYSGIRPVDDWLRAQFGVTDFAYKFGTTKIYRFYVNDEFGIPPRGSATITIPFYSQLVGSPDGRNADQYIDWWNGGRILLYDQKSQIEADYKVDAKNPVAPITGTPCATLDWPNKCKAVNVFSAADGLPDADRSQLLEYTFADAITAGGTLPYPIKLSGVGYNISSVDQVYLPVAMQPLGNKVVPYIGTVSPVGDATTPNTFRYELQQFLKDYPGWPIYNPTNTGLPVRIPGAYNVFVAGFDPKSLLLSPNPPGASAQAMKALYDTCVTNNGTAALCTPYRQVIALFDKNYTDYIDPNGPCKGSPITDAGQLQLAKLQRLYGWVPFKTATCSNDLLFTFGKEQFDILQAAYIKNLMYTPDYSFNPYVKLIHDPKYLDMAAYAFSVDDAIGFQSYKGDGLIITVGGPSGLDNTTKLDKKKRVVVTLQVKNIGVAQWSSVGVCSQQADFTDVDPLHPSVEFYPTGYPCTFTAADLKGRLYQLVLQSGPTDSAGLTISCTGVVDPNWCSQAQVVTINGERNFINTIGSTGDPAPSTHDFNGDAKSDLLWRDAGGNVAAWLMNSASIIAQGSVGNFTNAGAIVGQRDFNLDGKADLLVRDSAGNTSIWLMNGTQAIPATIRANPLSLGMVPPSFSVVGTGDFNGDGLGDILWQELERQCRGVADRCQSCSQRRLCDRVRRHRRRAACHLVHRRRCRFQRRRQERHPVARHQRQCVDLVPEWGHVALGRPGGQRAKHVVGGRNRGLQR